MVCKKEKLTLQLLHDCYRKRCTIVTESAALVFTENAVFSVSVYTFTGRSVAEAHEKAFAYFQGIPRHLVYDQTGC